ncbi:GDSL esterase/lipase [Cucumis melo var. makuwa]|uniref:GDSL esterase/lipase n=1 Tax=Cucumis melo var. makuwa TaxID=1194695 RepID=A0A5A7V7P0_CUCMM|nr:GDSL esterase/lipase [Cucumis melo var. makuwa]
MLGNSTFIMVHREFSYKIIFHICHLQIWTRKRQRDEDEETIVAHHSPSTKFIYHPLSPFIARCLSFSIGSSPTAAAFFRLSVYHGELENLRKGIERVDEGTNNLFQENEMLDLLSNLQVPIEHEEEMEEVLENEISFNGVEQDTDTTRKWSIPDAENHVGIKNVGNKGFPDALNNASGAASGKPSFPTHHEGVGKNTSGKGVFPDAVNSASERRQE